MTRKGKILIDEDIRIAQTMPAAFYRSPDLFEKARTSVFEPSWQFGCSKSDLPEGAGFYPFEFIPELLPEPLVFTKDKKAILQCLSNVCTHRGNLLAFEPGSGGLSCRYHGRCFRLDGSFKSMPGFDGVQNFPDETDNLIKTPFGEWGGLLFSALQPNIKFEDWIHPIKERLEWLPLDRLRPMKEADQDFNIKAHWALYCDNYLEGFHIPFVHPALNIAIGTEPYEVHLYDYGSLQIGLAKEGEPCFNPPKGSPDYGKRVYAYYFWLFPNLMLNFYPWGLSLNQVIPINKTLSQVRYRTFAFADTNFDRASNSIEKTELEDQEVVEATQRGINGRFYDRGRYSPKHERAVHHFHRLIAARLNVTVMSEDQKRNA